jgi:hypothetical protein
LLLPEVVAAELTGQLEARELVVGELLTTREKRFPRETIPSQSAMAVPRTMQGKIPYLVI